MQSSWGIVVNGFVCSVFCVKGKDLEMLCVLSEKTLKV